MGMRVSCLVMLKDAVVSQKQAGRKSCCCLSLMRGICYRHGHSGYLGSSGSVNRLIASNPLGRQTSNRAESGSN